MKEVTPSFGTPKENYNANELIKLDLGIRGNLKEEFRNFSYAEIKHESEIIAKSHGIYLEFNRAKSGKEKDWNYMIRLAMPAGGPITRRQWQILDDLADKVGVSDEGKASLRLTTRQCIQYHWVKKEDVVELIQTVAKAGFFSLNGCGDNVRNVMASPASIKSQLFDATDWAQKIGKYFQLDIAPHIEIFAIDPAYVREDNNKPKYQYSKMLLNRKFKIAIGSFVRHPETGEYIADNCVELRTNDLGIAPLLEGNKITRFQLYIGGGQGQRSGKATIAVLAKPLCIVNEEDLLATCDAVVKIHEEWSDRSERNWARLKYTVMVKGISWYQDRLKEKNINFEQPLNDFDYGDRLLHHGWTEQETDGLWSYGCYIECGRLMDGMVNGDIKKMVRYAMDNYDVVSYITPNQDLIFMNISDADRETFKKDLKKFGYGERNGNSYSTLRKNSGACVALHTCRLAYTESEKYIPTLIDELDKAGYGDLNESIGMTGCERQCFRPATKTIGLVGSGKKHYQVKLMGSCNGRTQGREVIDNENNVYLRMVAKEDLLSLISALFDYYTSNRASDIESMGEFHNRIGMQAIIEHLKANDAVAPLMAKTFKPVFIPDYSEV